MKSGNLFKYDCDMNLFLCRIPKQLIVTKIIKNTYNCVITDNRATTNIIILSDVPLVKLIPFYPDLLLK